MSLYRFITLNKSKGLTVKAFCYAGWYRMCLLLIRPKKLYPYWGDEGKESPDTDTIEHYRYAIRVSQIVNRYCDKTSWESKCLVRALTARKLLNQKGIHTTMYLGCGVQEGKMVAHAWLRCGEIYVTGGNGDGYAVVDRFYQ